MNKVRIFVVLLGLFVLLTGLFLYIEPEDVSGGYYIENIYTGKDVANVTLTLPALIFPKTGELYNLTKYSAHMTTYGIYKIEEKELVNTPYGKMLKINLPEQGFIWVGSELYERGYGKDYTDYLSANKPWAGKLATATMSTLDEFEFDFSPKFNEKLREVKLRYGLGRIIFPLERIEDEKDFDETALREVENSLTSRGYVVERLYIFKKFDTFGMAEFEGNGTLEINLVMGGCRIKKFFFLPISPDARDSACYNLVGGFTTNKSGEFVPFEVIGYAFRRISP